MIIKGKSRGGPKQLATHLQRADTNERVEVMELPSSAKNLTDAFKEWQLIAEGTNGTRGLYHANIDPDARYSMTAEQWKKSVDTLERELGLDGQPRAVVLHEKEGRQHIHVVWQRTDIDTMTMISDSQNYRAHESASLALEKAFGHEIVPGKHDKRMEAEPAPVAEITHAEWQQAERTGVDPRQLKDEITALFRASDSAAAFQKALDDAGLIVAKGDRRDFVLVDEMGEVHSLARQIRGVTAKDLRGFMEGIDASTLPSVAQAKEQQSLRPPPAPKAITDAPTTPEPMPPKDDTKFEQHLTDWHTEDMRQLAEFHAGERDHVAASLEKQMADMLAQSEMTRDAALARYDAQAKQTWVARFTDNVIGWIAPEWAARRKEAREEKREAVVRALDRQRSEETARLEAGKKVELDDLAERQSQQVRERELQFSDELSRRVRDYDEAKRFAERLAEQQRQRELEAQKHQTAGPEPPISAR